MVYVDTIKIVLEYFDKILKDNNQIQKLSIAADIAVSDRLLFEKFEMWIRERDDEVFLFHIDRFFEKKDLQPLSASEQDLTKRYTNFFKSAEKAMGKKAFKKAVKQGKKKAKTLLGQSLIDGLSDAVMSERAFRQEEDEIEDFFLEEKEPIPEKV